jgi:hypothetical protein
MTKHLKAIKIDYRGPFSAELFKTCYVKPTEFQHTVVGTGESYTIAAVRALSHLRELDLGRPVFLEVEEAVQQALPHDASAIATPQDGIDIYCVLSLDVEER